MDLKPEIDLASVPDHSGVYCSFRVNPTDYGAGLSYQSVGVHSRF